MKGIQPFYVICNVTDEKFLDLWVNMLRNLNESFSNES